jgi:4,4'-diaponeurosporenoate glycosyltransferase
MWWFLAGWTIGWLLLCRPRPLPAASAERARAACAVVIPARNEALVLPRLLGAVGRQRREGDELVVVDDGSTDDTAAVAARLGATVVVAPELPDGWMGKPHACALGASSTRAPVLVFVDADVEVNEGFLDRVVASVPANSLLTVQPWHRTECPYEQLSMLPGVVALMGSAAFTALGRRAGATMAFGPVIAVRRDLYDQAGGHGHPSVRSSPVEDLALARLIGRTEIYSGRPEVRFRMFPDGARRLVDGWTRTLTAGATATPWWTVLAIVAWVSSLAAGWMAWRWAYPLSALQFYVLGRLTGRLHPLTAVLYPLAVVAFLVLVARSVTTRVLRRPLRWKGRQLRAK